MGTTAKAQTQECVMRFAGIAKHKPEARVDCGVLPVGAGADADGAVFQADAAEDYARTAVGGLDKLPVLKAPAADGAVEDYVVFQGDRMKIYDRVQDSWNVRVTFKDAAALRNFLFSRNQDIVDSILANAVTVDGNLNYIYKFGFMARDLLHRLGAL